MIYQDLDNLLLDKILPASWCKKMRTVKNVCFISFPNLWDQVIERCDFSSVIFVVLWMKKKSKLVIHWNLLTNTRSVSMVNCEFIFKVIEKCLIASAYYLRALRRLHKPTRANSKDQLSAVHINAFYRQYYPKIPGSQDQNEDRRLEQTKG